MIRFACPNCEKVYTVPASAGGKPATCKQCGTRFQIPDAPPSIDYEVVEEPSSAPPSLPPPPAPPPPPVPPPPSVQHAETMVLAKLPDLPSKQMEIPAIPDLDSLPPPPPPAPSSLSFGASPPAPPAPPETVQLQPCPTCGARLTVNAEDVGAHVECPMCKTVFQGQSAPTPAVVTPAPPPPPEPADVDIAPCPKCRAELTVSETDLGQEVECPHCQTVYKAERPQPKAGTQLAKSVRVPAPPPSRIGGDEGKKKPYEFKPKSKKKDSPFADDDDEDDDDRPSKRKSRRDDDDDDDDDDRPRKKKKRRRSRSRSYDDSDDDRYRSYSPHDGGTLLIWAIVGFFCCWFINIYVLIKSTQSINEIRSGTMDPSGRGLLEAARIIAIIDMILVVIGIGRWIITMAFVGAGSAVDPDY